MITDYSSTLKPKHRLHARSQTISPKFAAWALVALWVLMLVMVD